MKEYYVTKRITSPDDSEIEGLSNEDLENPDNMDDSDVFEKFYVVKLRDGKKDITSMIDTNLEFEGDDELAEYLGKVFNQDPDKIEIIEEESTIEMRS